MSENTRIQAEYRKAMNDLARELDHRFNGDGPKKIGFALLIYDFGAADGRRMNYIGNGQRDEVKTAIKELLARWEGRYSEITGHG